MKKKLFNDTDNSGIHLSETGQELLQDTFCEAIFNAETKRKRGRDENLATPPSTEKKDNKITKSVINE